MKSRVIEEYKATHTITPGAELYWCFVVQKTISITGFEVKDLTPKKEKSPQGSHFPVLIAREDLAPGVLVVLEFCIGPERIIKADFCSMPLLCGEFERLTVRVGQQVLLKISSWASESVTFSIAPKGFTFEEWEESQKGNQK